MIFNVDAESYVYEPAEFKRDNEDLRIWEWSDDRINDSSLFILVKIAISKKAQARYDGPKNYEVIPITPQQKGALSRQLQIYKGLLLGYDK